MLKKEFRNEDPTGRIIALVLLIVSLIGGGAFAVKLGLKGLPPLKMALFRCILGLIAVGGIGFYNSSTNRPTKKKSGIASLYPTYKIKLDRTLI